MTVPGDPAALDRHFREAVSAIDAGDAGELERLLLAHPGLASERPDSASAWLRNEVGGSLDGYFRQPFLLWFVAGNPVRKDTLADNIARIASVIIDAARHEGVASLQEQLDYTLGLVVTGRIARESGVQIGLMDTLIDAGAVPGAGHGALGGGNFEAASHLVERGGELTLATALCLGRTDDVERLARTATAQDRQIALAAAALNGQAPALARLIELGVDIDAYSAVIHPHATALHHAVFSGSLDAVEVLVDAGARQDIEDRIFHGTALQWAEHDQTTATRSAIADYLRAKRSG